MRANSILRRLSVTTIGLLVVFLGLLGWGLQYAHRLSLEEGVKEQLLGHVYALLGEAEPDKKARISMPKLVSDPRLNQVGAAISATLFSLDGRVLWRSESLLGQPQIQKPQIKTGKSSFYSSSSHYQLAYGFIETAGTYQVPYILVIQLKQQQVAAQTNRFEKLLWLGLLLLGAVLLVSQFFVLDWGLKPLKTVAEALQRIHSGRDDRLRGDFPAEILPLTRNINALLQHNQVQQQRYRHSLDDLAHSLKTPLAVIQTALESNDTGLLQDSVKQVLPDMNLMIKGRLREAALSGRSVMASRVNLQQLIERLMRSLVKIYSDKSIVYDNSLKKDLSLAGEENDYLELFGNLLDNACKYGKSQILIEAEQTSEMLVVSIQDDGPGISQAQVKQVLTRGQRLDEQQQGQGIGLAAVREIVALYQGKVRVDKSKILGGADIQLSFKL